MPGHHHQTGSSNASRRRSSHRRSLEPAARPLEDPVKEASRAALRQAQRRHARRHSSGSAYYAIPRTETPEIPSYETFLAEARARVDHRVPAETTYRLDPASVNRYQHYQDPYHGQYQFYPNPYLYGYPSGYYQEIRAPLHYTDSTRTGKSGQSTLVGSGSDTTTHSPTLVGSGRPSVDRTSSVRTAQPVRTLHQHPRRQNRVSWGPTYTLVEPSSHHVSNTVSSSSSPNTNKPLPSLPSEPLALSALPHGAQTLSFTPPPSSPVPSLSHTATSTPSSSSTEDGLLPTTSIKPINLNPLLFTDHKTYLTPDSAIQRREAERDRRSRARFAALARLQSSSSGANAQAGSAGAGNDDGDAVAGAEAFRSKWSPDTSPDLRPLRKLVRSLSVGSRRKGHRKRRESAPSG